MELVTFARNRLLHSVSSVWEGDFIVFREVLTGQASLLRKWVDICGSLTGRMWGLGSEREWSGEKADCTEVENCIRRINEVSVYLK